LMRLCMTLAYYAFFSIWSDSIKARFDFSPQQQVMILDSKDIDLSCSFSIHESVSFFILTSRPR
jgi:hypothetical protein